MTISETLYYKKRLKTILELLNNLHAKQNNRKVIDSQIGYMQQHTPEQKWFQGQVSDCQFTPSDMVTNSS
jgi:hypothetical protein